LKISVTPLDDIASAHW